MFKYAGQSMGFAPFFPEQGVKEVKEGMNLS